MRTEESRPVRLADYRPPDWLVETVELDIRLDPTATRVRATLALKPNSAATAPAPLVLDGEKLSLDGPDESTASRCPPNSSSSPKAG